MKAYGFKQPHLLNQKEISSSATKLHIPEKESFGLDIKYFYALQKKDTMRLVFEKKCSPMISKYMQPLEILYFDEEGKLISFHSNCYTGGFPKLKWNRYGQFNKFVPETTIPLTDTVLNRDFLFHYLQPLDKINSFEKTKLTVVVFWCDFMFKQSKTVIKTAKDNLQFDSNKQAKIIFVNTDNCFIDDEYSKQINKKE